MSDTEEKRNYKQQWIEQAALSHALAGNSLPEVMSVHNGLQVVL
uniref:Uncharacterized protein n=1 Tax=Peronospora matthiolae TaxID=2874970 RepID=A0AAV1V7I6_9STRA